MRFRPTLLTIAVALVLLAAPLQGAAQQSDRVARIGLLSSFSPSDTAAWYEAFRQGLRDLGWVEGKNLNVEYRYAKGVFGDVDFEELDLV